MQADTSDRRFSRQYRRASSPTIFPVYDHDKVVGTIATAVLPKTDPAQWDAVKVGDLTQPRHHAACRPIANSRKRLRLLVREGGDQMLLVTDDSDRLVGIVTKTDILRSFQNGGRRVPSTPRSAP